MKPTEQQQKLGIYLGTGSESSILLSQLIANQFDSDKVPCNVALSITLAPSIEVTIIDDLLANNHCAHIAAIRHEIEFILHRYSLLSYHCPMVSSDAQGRSEIEKIVSVKLFGKSSQANVYCSWHGIGVNNCVFKTVQDHQAERTKSSLEIKGVLEDSSTIKCTNLIKVAKTACKVMADQTNKNIVLSPNTRVITLPQLEIENNDVQCRHGAAISRFNEEDLFYLQSRGVDAAAIKKMMIDGFLASTID